MDSVLFRRVPVLVRGGGDLGSGAVYRLRRAGFPVVVTELEAPLLVRRAVCYGAAMYQPGQPLEIDGLRALYEPGATFRPVVEGVDVPVYLDPGTGIIRERWRPAVIVDARMEKRNIDTGMHDAPLVVALGPGFIAGQDCHAVVETNRGHHLGRAIYAGPAEADTGEPGAVAGQTHSRVLRAPAEGHVRAKAAIGDMIGVGQVLAFVGDQPLTAPFSGVLRGLIHERVRVQPGMKIGDLDPRAQREHCFTISDKALAVGGGVLEAVLASPQIRAYLVQAEDETAKGI